MKKIILLLAAFAPLLLNAQGKSDLRIEVQNLRNMNGKLRISLFNGPEGFPEDAESAWRSETLDLNADDPVFIFHELSEGEYAFAILHDEDEDGKMKKNFLGIPGEGFAFSNNFRPKTKNPSFENASFIVSESTDNEQVIEIVYY